LQTIINVVCRHSIWSCFLFHKRPFLSRELVKKHHYFDRRNFSLGSTDFPLGFINMKKEKEIANEIMANKIGFRGRDITGDLKVKNLSGDERQGMTSQLF
jgi:hypothetical protein